MLVVRAKSFLLAIFGGDMMMIITYNPHRDTEEPGPGLNPNPGRRTSWVNVVWKVWMSVSVSEDPPTPGDTL